MTTKYINQEVAMLYDSSKCTACKGCQVACKQWNVLFSPLGLNENKFTGSYQAPLDLNGSTRLIMTFKEKKTESKIRPVEWAFGRRSCFHCTEAGCAMVCPTGALKIQPNGVVSVNKEICIGCQYCQIACPFDVPRYYGVGDDTAKIDKCTMCWDRLENGMKPACVTTCQPGALHFGPRDEMIKIGKERVAFMKSKGYDKAELYGEKEMGGLHILQVCKFGHEAADLPSDPKLSPMVSMTQLSKPAAGLAAIATAGGLAISLIAAIGYRRKKLSVEEARKTWTARQRQEGDKLVVEELDKIKKDQADQESK